VPSTSGRTALRPRAAGDLPSRAVVPSAGGFAAFASRSTHLTATFDPAAPPATILNLRDLGGHRTRSGDVVRRGLAYRSADLAGLEPAGAAAALERLGVRTIYDLRTSLERRRHPDRGKLPDGTRYVVADVMRDSPAGSPAHLYRLMTDPQAANARFGGGRSVIFFEERYREFVSLGSARAALRRMFLGLSNPARLPGLFHCTTGKDRTGWAAAALQLLLDVPEEVVIADYLASNAALTGTMDQALDRFEAAGGDPAALEPLTRVRSSYLEAALSEMHRAYGSIAAYVTDALGIDDAGQRRLRDVFIGD